jgi:hypothetical protein
MVSHALRERGMRERITKADEARLFVSRAYPRDCEELPLGD